jgi:NAD(P)-dependent dehydrogenase (short-subunit alcohol dehydrogenase family)
MVVTGASTGIGAATARELARRGFHVLAGVRRDSDGEPLRSAGVEPVILDITDPDHVAELAARVERDPRPLRALVNNAGIPGAGPIEVTPINQWRRIFEVNVFGHVAVTQALLPALLRGGGRVVNITSLNGKISMAGYGPYAASKFAMEAVSDALRNELASHGVQVVVVEPGGVKTEMSRAGLAALRRLGDGMTSGQNARYGALMQQGGDRRQAPHPLHHRRNGCLPHPGFPHPSRPDARPDDDLRPPQALPGRDPWPYDRDTCRLTDQVQRGAGVRSRPARSHRGAASGSWTRPMNRGTPVRLSWMTYRKGRLT